MNNFQLFKFRAAGFKNHHLLRIVDYMQTYDTSLTVRDYARIAEYNPLCKFLENYRQLDTQKLKEAFYRYPSISILDHNYPQELKESFQPPVLLFYKGDIDLLKKPKLALVGARDLSEIGKETIHKLVSQLENRFVIVSGLARGADREAHLAAIHSYQSTIGVIGCGLDIAYPKQNASLQAYMEENHLVLSEYAPGEGPRKYHFPERNRIIAGLSKGVIVVEAKRRSGSLITCERAMEEGRDVFAVPGEILSGRSQGCIHLIQEGAKCISSGKDIIEEYIY